MNASESFITHLIELRTRLLNSVVALLLVFICLFPWASDLYALLAQPLVRRQQGLQGASAVQRQILVVGKQHVLPRS